MKIPVLTSEKAKFKTLIRQIGADLGNYYFVDSQYQLFGLQNTTLIVFGQPPVNGDDIEYEARIRGIPAVRIAAQW